MDGSEPSQDQTEQSSGEDEEVAEEDQADADSSNSAKRVRSLQPKYPRHNVERALRIAKAIFDQNGGGLPHRTRQLPSWGARAPRDNSASRWRLRRSTAFSKPMTKAGLF